jgi:predicted DNA-binding protein YlxM (UPF0122 family)
MWATNFDKCIVCGTIKIRHASKGLCRRCYQASIESKHKKHNKLPEISVTILTKEFLLKEYIENSKSLSDLAKECGCSRQFVYKKLKEYGIPGRKKRDARLIALKKDKISYTRTDKDGNVIEVTHQKSEVDEYFYSYWSAPMAWVLGFIYADGNMTPGTLYGKKNIIKRYHGARVTISQKEPEVLEKIKALMRCNTKLSFSNQRILKNTTAGKCYHLCFNSMQIYGDLMIRGVTPNKSLRLLSLMFLKIIYGTLSGDVGMGTDVYILQKQLETSLRVMLAVRRFSWKSLLIY